MSLMIKSWLAILFWAQISIGTSAIPRIRAVENRKQCYRTQALVGWGRHGTVHRAVPSTQPGTIVAVKKVKLPTGSSSKPEVDFLQAFSQTSSYCGVPRLFDLIRSGNSLYMVEQYFEGRLRLGHIFCSPVLDAVQQRSFRQASPLYWRLFRACKH